MKQLKFLILALGLVWTTAILAGEPLGFGLLKKYCLGDICLGEADADHPELKIGEALRKAARYKKIPICNSSDASVYLRDVKFRNGTQGVIYLLADPGSPNAQPEKYFRISSITVKFDPFLSAEGVKELQQKIAARYGMERSSSYSFGVKDGKRSISFTVSPWESRIAVNGIDNPEFQAQPGCSPKIPNL
ncbi:hypothetical protein SCT_2334 [Sulfuricella sp. T08]|uniref:hypothetical protein n=1 Tax=Sulfuricella sp. T08 TaxID=1632857 RepID=UPI0006179E9B|nr:hypothetical protein [Sulfuricella sp. T08]GAO36919.1 hypothetical protein SCT_2334 [Sulfuricella sp. T08]